MYNIECAKTHIKCTRIEILINNGENQLPPFLKMQ